MVDIGKSTVADDEPDCIDYADEKITEAYSTLKKVSRLIRKILKELRASFMMLMALLKAFVNAGAHMGSFMYFVNTTVKVGKVVCMFVGSVTTAKVARDMITSGESSVSTSLNITA